MKKLIAIAVVFVLVAGAAFAVDVSAEVIGETKILFSDTSEATDGKLHAGDWPGGLRRVRVAGDGQNEEGTFGGWFRLEKYGYSGGDDDGIRVAGYAWWQPIEQLKLQLGMNPDGFYGRDGVARWGFYQVGGDTDVIHEGWAFGNSFYEGYGTNGLLVSLTPIENLFMFFGIPFSSGGGWNEAKDVFGKMHAQVAYDIGGVGQVALTFRGDLGDTVTVNTDGSGSANGSKLFLYFGLSAIENLGIDLGLGYTLPVTADVGPASVTYNAPMAIGLGFKFDAGAFGVKARVQAQLGESVKVKDVDDDWKGNTVIDFDVLPYFAVSDTVSVLLSAGLQITSPADNEKVTGVKPGDPTTGWHIEPYVTVKSSWWAPNFYAGIRIDSDGKKGKDATGKETDPVVNWSVPIGIVFAF
jgi:hypothetical protein